MSSKSDMLGDAVRKLVELPSTTLGIIYDLLCRLHDPEWVGALKKFLRKEKAWPTYPADTEIFQLTFDGNVPENDPLEMVRLDGFNSSYWKFNGRKISGIQTRWFKLVRVGVCQNLDEVREKLTIYGDIPEGQWMKAFKTAFHHHDHDNKGTVMVADPSWVDPGGDVRFPCVDSHGDSYFGFVNEERSEYFRWLVPAEKSS